MTSPGPGPEHPSQSCARCHRGLRPPAPAGSPRRRDPDGRVVALRSWPEGPVCSGCYARACETYGTCSGCGAHRLLPGRSATGQLLCTDCADGLGNFTCARCGTEGWKHYRGLCGRCVLRDRLPIALAEPTGQVPATLAPLLEYLCAMPRPRTGILWLTKPHTHRLLAALAHGRIPLTHAGLDQLTPPKAVAHLRHLLIASGLLPPIDTTLHRTTAWAAGYLAAIPVEEDRSLLHRYDKWVLQRRLLEVARAGPLNPGQDANHRYQLRQAHEFLTWARETGQGLDGLTQADLDAWTLAATSGQRTAIRALLAWATKTSRSRPLDVPRPVTQPVTPLSQQDRITWIRRAVHNPHLDPADRVLILLLLLYAQPIPKISRLKLTDLTVSKDGRPAIRLGEPPAPPDPTVRRSLLRLPRARRADHYRQPPQPVALPRTPRHPAAAPDQPAPTPAKPRAVPDSRQNQQPAPPLNPSAPAVISHMLGYATTTTERSSRNNAATWARYAASRRQAN